MKKRDENSQPEMLEGAKSMGAGAATIASAGAAVGIGNVFSSFSVLREIVSMMFEFSPICIYLVMNLLVLFLICKMENTSFSAKSRKRQVISTTTGGGGRR